MQIGWISNENQLTSGFNVDSYLFALVVDVLYNTPNIIFHGIVVHVLYTLVQVQFLIEMGRKLLSCVISCMFRILIVRYMIK